LLRTTEDSENEQAWNIARECGLNLVP